MNRESDVIFDPFGVTHSDQLSGAAKSKFGLLFGKNTKTLSSVAKLNTDSKELIEAVKHEVTSNQEKRNEIFFEKNNQEKQGLIVPEVSSLDKLLRELNSLQDEDLENLEEDKLPTEENDPGLKEDSNEQLAPPMPLDNPPHNTLPTMPRSGVPVSMMEESRNLMERGEIQFIMNVSVNGRRKSLHIHSKDNALNLAQSFVKTHDLPQVKIAALAKHITNNRSRIVGVTTAQPQQKPVQRTPKSKRKHKKTSSRSSRANTPAVKRGRHPARSQSSKRNRPVRQERGRRKKASSVTKKRPNPKSNRPRAHSVPRKGKKPKNVFSRLYKLAEKSAIKKENQARKQALKHLAEIRHTNTSKMSHGSRVIMKNSVNKDDTTKASERLYRHGLVQSIRREQTFRKRIKEMEMEDVDGCTFTPRITNMARELKREGSKIWKRIKDPMGIQMQYRKQERQEKALSKELMKCVFRPKINEGSERIAMSRMEREHVVTRLSRTPRPPRRSSRRSRHTPRKRRIQKSKQNELFKRLQRPKTIVEVPEDPETTFHPKINKNPNNSTRTRLSEIGDYLHRKETLAFQSAQGKLEPPPTPQSPLTNRRSSVMIRGILDKRFIELWAVCGGDNEQICRILPEAISMDSFDQDSQELMASVLTKLKKLNKLIDFPTFKETLEKELEKTKHKGPNVLLRSRRASEIDDSELVFSPQINTTSADIVKKNKNGKKKMDHESPFSFSDPCLRMYYEAEKARKAAKKQDSALSNSTEVVCAEPNSSCFNPTLSTDPKSGLTSKKDETPDS